MWAAKLPRNWSLAGQILSVHSTGVMPQEQSLSKFARSHYNGNEWCLRLCLRDPWLSVSFLSRLRVYVDFYGLLLISAFIAAFPSFLDCSLMPVPSHFYLETSSSTNGLCSPFFVWPSLSAVFRFAVFVVSSSVQTWFVSQRTMQSFLIHEPCGNVDIFCRLRFGAMNNDWTGFLSFNIVLQTTSVH